MARLRCRVILSNFVDPVLVAGSSRMEHHFFSMVKESIDKIGPQTYERKAGLKMIVTRRIIVFISIGLLLYMALKTEPVAAIAMVVVITVTTWVQVIVYNHRLNREPARRRRNLEVIEHPIVFTLFGLIPVRDTVLYTWITMAGIIALVLILKLIKPNLLEYLLEMIISILDDAMDVDDLHPYIPLLGSLMIFTLVSNTISIFPRMKSPTSDINTTIALAVIVVLSVHVYGIIRRVSGSILRNLPARSLCSRWKLSGSLAAHSLYQFVCLETL